MVTHDDIRQNIRGGYFQRKGKGGGLMFFIVTILQYFNNQLHFRQEKTCGRVATGRGNFLDLQKVSAYSSEFFSYMFLNVEMLWKFRSY